MSDVQRVGEVWGNRGGSSPFTAGPSGNQRVADAHARFFDAAWSNRLYTFGISNTALVAANAIATGLTSTAQPIIGVWNPPSSGKILSILQLILPTTTVANSAVSPGGYAWVYAAGAAGITTGSTPISCSTLLASGSNTKAFAISTALTGLVGSVAFLRETGIQTINAAGPATAIHQALGNIVENVDGGLLVPPGGLLAVMGQVSTTTVSCSPSLIWEELTYTM